MEITAVGGLEPLPPHHCLRRCFSPININGKLYGFAVRRKLTTDAKINEPS